MSLLPMLFKGLTPELIKKAEDELNETPQVKMKALLKLKELIKNEGDINCRLDDIFLTRFLRVKKYDVQKALKVLRNYYNFQMKYSCIFTHIKPSEVEKDFETNVIFYPCHRLEDGSHITIAKLSNYNTHITTAERLVALVFIWGELIMECEASQISGANLIIDLQDATFKKYMTFLNRNYIKLMVESLTESWPMRIRGIHFMNEPYICHVTYNVIKRILKRKIIEKIHFHGSDYNSLHKYVPKDVLPEELGGSLGPMDCNQLRTFFFSQEAFFERIYKYGISVQKE